jgi:hypothetical protein
MMFVSMAKRADKGVGGRKKEEISERSGKVID